MRLNVWFLGVADKDICRLQLLKVMRVLVIRREVVCNRFGFGYSGMSVVEEI